MQQDNYKHNKKSKLIMIFYKHKEYLKFLSILACEFKEEISKSFCLKTNQIAWSIFLWCPDTKTKRKKEEQAPEYE